MADVRKLKNYIDGEWVESKTDKYETSSIQRRVKCCAKCRYRHAQN